MLRTLLILDEEVVERAEQKSDGERTITSNVKDAMRTESVPHILSLMTCVLTQYQKFEVKAVRQTLKVISQLIDWNELSMFNQQFQYFMNFLNFKEFRAPAFGCISAIVDKGMLEGEKLMVVQQINYIQLVSQVTIIYRETDQNQDIEDQEAEEEFVSAVTESMLKIG